LTANTTTKSPVTVAEIMTCHGKLSWTGQLPSRTILRTA
jgi:hypothetical protein